MDKTRAFVYAFVATMVAGVILGISGFCYLNAQENKSKEKQQFERCVESGGSFLKVGRAGDPVCIK